MPYNQAVVEDKTLIYEMRRFVKEYENEYFTYYRPSIPTYRLIGSQKSTAKFEQVCAEEK